MHETRALTGTVRVRPRPRRRNWNQDACAWFASAASVVKPLHCTRVRGPQLMDAGAHPGDAMRPQERYQCNAKAMAHGRATELECVRGHALAFLAAGRPQHRWWDHRTGSI